MKDESKDDLRAIIKIKNREIETLLADLSSARDFIVEGDSYAMIGARELVRRINSRLREKH